MKDMHEIQIGLNEKRKLRYTFEQINFHANLFTTSGIQ